MSANGGGGSSHAPGTLKTLISSITKVEMDKYCKSTPTGGSVGGGRKNRDTAKERTGESPART